MALWEVFGGYLAAQAAPLWLTNRVRLILQGRAHAQREEQANYEAKMRDAAPEGRGRHGGDE